MSQPVVLVPLDGSANAEAALPYAEAVARATGAALRLLAVIEIEGEWDSSPALREYFETVRGARLRRQLDKPAGEITKRGLPVETILVTGEPVDEILAAADAGDVSMVVMSTHGYGGLERLLIGSVADKVMRMVAKPALLIRPSDTSVKEPVRLRRLLVPLDGSGLAESALPVASELARALGVTLLLARVAPFAGAVGVPFAPGVDVSAIEDQIVAEATTYLQGIARSLPDGVESAVVVLRGAPTDALATFSRSERIDVIVMTTHGYGGLRRFVLGSTADRLVRAGIPTLLIHPPSAAAAAGVELALHCAACGRLVTREPIADARCPRCRRHLHTCANCVFWDTTGCVLQRTEAHITVWPGRDCPRFIFRATPPPVGTPHMVEAGATD